IRLLTSEIAHAVRAHPDGQSFLSFFRRPDSVVTAATLLAEMGACRARYPPAEQLAADAGMSPVAVESGRRKVACFRRGCDHRLRDATSTLADATRHWHPWAADRHPAPRPPWGPPPRAGGGAPPPSPPPPPPGLQPHIAVTTPTRSSPRLAPPA